MEPTKFPMSFLLDNLAMKFRILVVLLWACLSVVIAQDIPPRPSPPRLVNDLAEALSPSERDALEQKLVAYNDSTSTQIAVVIVPTTGDYPIADYAFKIGREWGVGQKDKDNGIVLLWAPNDREVYIATGYGMEGALPDIFAKRIISNVIIPEFKNKRFYQGLDLGVDEIIRYASGEYKASASDEGDSILGLFIVVFIMLLIVVLIIGKFNNPNNGSPRTRSSGGGPVIFPYDTYSGWGRSSGNWGGGGSSGGGFGGFGGGSFGGGGAGGSY